jgi:hypothetical protein
VEQGIDSISLTPDSVMAAVQFVAQAEAKLGIDANEKAQVAPHYANMPPKDDLLEISKEISDALVSSTTAKWMSEHPEDSDSVLT